MIDRRSILRGALFGAGLSAFSRDVVAATTRSLRRANPVLGLGQVLWIFLRGGNDGVNTVIPFGDLTYPTARPSLKIPEPLSHAMQGVTYTKLNPNLLRLVNVDQAGRLAALHQIGDPMASRSHFTAMDMFETASQPVPPITQADLATKHGFVPRIMSTIGAPALGAGNKPAALSVSGLMQKMFRAGDSVQLSAHARSLQHQQLALPYPMAEVGMPAALVQHALDHFANPASLEDEQLGANLAFGVLANSGLQSLQFDHATQFQQAFRFPQTPADLLAVSQLASLPPADLAVLPTYSPGGEAFMAAAEQAVYALINWPELRVAGIEIGGWDTHAEQAIDHPNLLRYLGWCLRDLDDEIQNAGLNDRITVIVVSEFGRTAKENTSLQPGTDHGCGGQGFAIGGKVVGGTYNCHSGTPAPKEFGQPWRELLDPAVLPGTPFFDACDVKTGFRDVIAEVAHKIFGVPLVSLTQVVPGYLPSTATFLNFLT